MRDFVAIVLSLALLGLVGYGLGIGRHPEPTPPPAPGFTVKPQCAESAKVLAEGEGLMCMYGARLEIQGNLAVCRCPKETK